MKLLFVLACSIGLAACAADDEVDDTLYLTGTEEAAVKTAGGAFVCPSPKKELICHIPPGNPENQHTICVSTNAVETHQSHHGDLVGACDVEDPAPEVP